MKKLILVALIGMGAAVGVAHASETMKGAQKDFQSFKAEMSTQLDTVEQKLAELKAKAKDKGSTAHDKTVQELEETQMKLKAELAELETKSSSNWKKIKRSFASSVNNLNTKLQKALNE